MNKSLLAILLILSASVRGFAEVEKFAVPSEHGIDFYWWPKLPAIAGWSHDEEASQTLAANVLVPDGSSFSAAPAVMYAKAFYKPRAPEIRSLRELVDSDRGEFEHSMPDLRVERLPDLATSDHHPLVQLSFSPKGDGNWERVAYGEEGDYYLIFAISAQSEADLKAALPAFGKLVAAYQETPRGYQAQP
jgi:hypothetical protein